VFSYVQYRDRYHDAEPDVIAVACAHPRLPSLSHDRAARGLFPGLRPADTSTGTVLNALAAGPWKRDVWAACQRRCGAGGGRGERGGGGGGGPRAAAAARRERSGGVQPLQCIAL
jgi:hypothetical protein